MYNIELLLTKTIFRTCRIFFQKFAEWGSTPFPPLIGDIALKRRFFMSSLTFCMNNLPVFVLFFLSHRKQINYMSLFSSFSTLVLVGATWTNIPKREREENPSPPLSNFSLFRVCACIALKMKNKKNILFVLNKYILRFFWLICKLKNARVIVFPALQLYSRSRRHIWRRWSLLPRRHYSRRHVGNKPVFAELGLSAGLPPLWRHQKGWICITVFHQDS